MGESYKRQLNGVEVISSPLTSLKSAISYCFKEKVRPGKRFSESKVDHSFALKMP